MNFGALIILAVIIQIVLLSIIFDIYFTSPIVRNINPIPNPMTPPSKRVVVISVDGLRLDALLENTTEGRPVAPYIRWSMSHRGSWGVSHTHLPTESRPGHVAMLAGFYEDPSAVTKGWKENPVDFDSVFNRSVCSFSWGSPDIVEIFYKGLKHNCSYRFTYNTHQDFSGDTREQDNWVVEHVEEFFKSGNPKKYTQNGVIFFLHLLGQDTSGHTHKPKTELYRRNLRNVDGIIKRVDEIFSKVFRDNGTSFILTADHGMTDWGSHGGGDETETATPVVAWGAGIRRNVFPLEIEQADLTPLISVLLGVSIPVNSVGMLPTEFLNFSRSEIAEALLLNAQQVGAIFLEKNPGEEIGDSVESVKNLIKLREFSEAMEEAQGLFKRSLDGIKVSEKLHQRPLFILASITFTLWIIFLLAVVHQAKFFFQFYAKICLPCFSLFLACFVQIRGFPLTYHAYTQLPTFLFFILISSRFSIKNPYLILYLIGVEAFVFGFFYRWIWTVIVLLITFSPFFPPRKPRKLLTIWLVSGITVAIFALLPVIGKQPKPEFNVVAAILAAVISNSLILKTIIFISGLNSYFVHTYFTDDGLKTGNQFISWLILGSTLLFLFRRGKLSDAFEAITPTFLLLSVSHEGIFLIALFVHLSSWVCMESGIYKRPSLHEKLSKNDLRRAWVFLAYTYVAFFGIGNFASVNSFDPAWVRCFVTVFSPYTMTSLILLKIIIPFLGVSLAFRALDVEAWKILVLVMVYSNVMGLNFLFLVRNEGSWLDIGTSISHYVIQQVAIVFFLVLNFISRLVLPDHVIRDKSHYF